MTENEVIILASKLAKGLHIGFFEHRTIAGKAYPKTRTVEFNTKLMHSEGFENTVIHEVAHILTEERFPNAKQAHGPEFRQVMRELGGTPNTYHTYNVEPSGRRVKRHIAKCDCMTHELTTPASKKELICRKCNATLTLTGEVKTITR